ncbi:MAG: hypothetical protein OWU84_07430 [Firmicutes bacterium]|nr:hypothetical protein [Bacillota bacterium]
MTFQALRERLEAEIQRQLGRDHGVEDGLRPQEFQGYAGILWGRYEPSEGREIRVRLQVKPWSLDERWTVMVRGRTLGEARFWEWLWAAPLCRIPFITPDFASECSQCGRQPCAHGAALAVRWLEELAVRPEFIFLLLNRQRPERPWKLADQPIQRVPLALGSNLDRTRRDLEAVVAEALQAAAYERDNVWGRTRHADRCDRA